MVFAVSGGVPQITTPLLAEIAGGETFGIPNAVYFALAALLVVTFVMKKTVAGRRFEAIGANPLAPARPGFRCGAIRCWPMSTRSCSIASPAS